jgi:glycosyltransferase involved in cell wall biosynthesis
MFKLAVCLATYNGERYLYEQISSILSQLGPQDKLIISDDGSSDSTREIVLSFGNKIQLINYSRLGGIIPNFENLLTYVSTLNFDYIALSDQDDVWMPLRVKTIKDSLEKYDMVMMNGDVVDGELNGVGIDVFDFVSYSNSFFKNLISNAHVGCCMAFRSNLLKFVLPFPKNILWHDWYIALVALLLFNSTANKTKTLLFRRHGENYSNTGKKSTRNINQKLISRFWMIHALIKVVRRYLKYKINFFNR